MLAGRKLAIASMHRKESALAPVLEKLLGVKCFVVDGLNTDQLGTFAGEVERTHDPLTTCRLKCQMAFDLGYDLAIASEGSFGPHPVYWFLPSDEEILCLIDKQNGWEVAVKETSTSTNFMSSVISSIDQLDAFLEKAKFPEHAVIIKAKTESDLLLKKGLISRDEVVRIFEEWHRGGLIVELETDMRAMHNPMRMAVIGAAAIKLANRVLSLCPECQTPGYGVVSMVSGLPCEICGYPTNTTKAHVWGCSACGHRAEVLFPDGKEKGEAMYCDVCNP